MKLFTKKSFMQKIIITLVSIILLSSTVAPMPAYAAIEAPTGDGGVLLEPIKDLLVFMTDVVQSLMQRCLKNNYTSSRLTVYTTPTDQDGDQWQDCADNDVEFPLRLYLTPELIFSNKISFLNANFIKEVNASGWIDGGADEDALNNLRNTIASWYVALRNLCLVGLLSVLVYVGIRIILSTTAGEKSKYKEMIKDWIVAVCLLFTLQYIMMGTFWINDKIVEMLSTKSNGIIPVEEIRDEGGESTTLVYFEPNKDKTKGTDGYADKFAKWAQTKGLLSDNSDYYNVANERFEGFINYTQYARTYAQLVGSAGFRFTLVYIALVAFTVIFLIKYISRSINLAFLTLIAPLITLTYPLDKIKDGQAQAFTTWIREFVFNVLLQPLHLIIYTTLVSTAMATASSNIIYPLVALGFIFPAEKLMRKMFGFDKASTAGNAFAGAAAGSFVANQLKNLATKSGKKSGGENGGKSGGGQDEPKNNRVGTSQDPYEGYLPEGGSTAEEAGAATGATLASDDEDNEGEDRVDEEARLAAEEERQQQIEDDFNRMWPEDETSESDSEDRLPEAEEVDENYDDEEYGGGHAGVAIAEERLRRKDGLKAVGNRVGRGVRHAARNITGIKREDGILKNIGNVGVKGLKFYGKAAGAVAAASLAGAAAVTTGDASKVLGAASAGAIAGKTLSKNGIEKSSAKINSIADTYNRGYYGDEYQERQNMKADKEWMDSQQTVDLFRENFGNENYEKAIEAGAAIRQTSGVTDDSAIIKALSMTTEFGGADPKEAISMDIARNMPALASKIGDKTFEDRKSYEQTRANIQQRFYDKIGNQTLAREQAEKCLKDVAKFKGKTIPVSTATKKPRASKNDNK